MRVLLLNQFFWPDEVATSQLLTDLARRLAAAGHAVSVICGRNGYTHALRSRPPAVAICRVPNAPFSRTSIGRVLSYASFIAGAAAAGLRTPRPEVVVSLTTPPGLPVLGAWLARVRTARHYIWEMDVYPEVAWVLGALKRTSLAGKLCARLLDAARQQADGIIALGPCMREHLITLRAPEGKIHVAENWADGETVRPLPLRGDGILKVLYSGNLGLAHELATLRAAALALKDDPQVRFVFAGGGALRAGFEEFCCRHGLSNVEFRPYCRRDQLSLSLGECDLGLVTQRPETLGCVVPSKTYAIMAAGRPVLFVGPRQATPARVIRRFECGWQINCGDVEGLVCLLRWLAAQPELLWQVGQRGRAAFLEHYDLPIGVGRICRIIGAELGARSVSQVPAVASATAPS